jgi:hypothetical protein
MVRNPQDNESLDRLGRVVLRSAALDDVESQSFADAPFLYTRVRARIAEEQRRNEGGNWFSLLSIAWRAVPAMALIALIAATVMFWSSRTSISPGWNRLDDEALSDTRNPGVEQAVLSRTNLSQEDIFEIVLARNGREKR